MKNQPTPNQLTQRTPASAAPESSGGGAGRSNGQRLRALAQNLAERARPWLVKLDTLPHARVAMIFVAGFAAGIIWDSYNGAARKVIAGWSTYLSWMAPTTSSERIRTMEAALATARQSLNKLATEMNKLESQGVDAPRRRSARSD
jgi:hypothetical protein